MNKNCFLKNAAIKWYSSNGRNFAWRTSNVTPYEYLILEILLQKTNANKVEPIYKNFIAKFPKVEDIDLHSEKELIDTIKMLGLYERKSRWIRSISKLIISEHSSIVPCNYEKLRELPGVGEYVANAVLCFAYNKPTILLDVNTARIISRIYGIPILPDLRRNYKLRTVVQKIKPPVKFKIFNWALMDIASEICVKKNPKHNMCPFKQICEAASKGNYFDTSQ